jgi:hypothetical protein
MVLAAVPAVHDPFSQLLGVHSHTAAFDNRLSQSVLSGNCRQRMVQVISGIANADSDNHLAVQYDPTERKNSQMEPKTVMLGHLTSSETED